jgi:hypothetical protein
VGQKVMEKIELPTNSFQPLTNFLLQLDSA